MNAKELERNSAATEAPVVKDLNEDPILPYEDNSFDYVPRPDLMNGGGWCMYESANFEGLVLGCIDADLCK